MKNNQPRLESIDQFRGFAILTMVLANYLAGVAWIPAWLKHAPDIGLTIIDLIAPAFIFAIGLTYHLSWGRRSRATSPWQTAGHFAGRYLAIIGIGAILSAGEIWIGYTDGGISWGVLQSIGVAGLITLVVIPFPLALRAATGVLLLALYQVAMNAFWLNLVLASPHGGLPGALDWAALLILSTVLAELFFDPARGRKWYPWISLLILLLGTALAFVSSLSKNRVSPSYILISLGASAILFWGFYGLVDRLRVRLPLLTAWGMNPLPMYVLHLVLLGIMVLPDQPGWYSQAPGWLVLLQALGLLALLSLAAGWLKRKQIIIAL